MAENMIKFLRGNIADLPAAGDKDTLYFVTDEPGIFMGTGSGMIRFGDFVQVDNIASLPENAHHSCLYYCVAENVFCRYDGVDWKQINKDTGMTSVEVIGEGNVVTSASYDAATRKLTLTKDATFATKDELDAVEKKVDDLADYVGEIPADYTESNVIAYINKKAQETLDAASGGSTESAASVLAALNTYKAENDPKVQALEDKVGEKAVGEQIDDKITELDLGNTYETKGEAAKVQATLETYIGTNDEAVAAAKEAADNAQAAADAKVASVTPADESITIGGTATAPTVAAKLSADADNALTLAADGLKVVIPAAAEYLIEKAENSGDYAAVYNLTKNGEIVGASINIPKDMVVESGRIVTDPAGQDAGTYIELKLQNVEEVLYINVGSLIEYVTSGSQTGDMIVINVSDDHKVTASITDGTVTLAKLDVDTQTKINKAHDHENKDVLDGINADKVAAWDAAEQNAKDHANDLNEAMNERVEALEAVDHDHENKDELDKIVDGDKAKWDEAYAKAHEHANKEVLDGITAEKVAAWDGAKAGAEATAAAALDAAKTELEGKITEGDEATLDAAKAFTNELANGQVTTNKDNIDMLIEALTWGSFTA